MSERAGGEDGSVLMLVPAGVLVLLMLGAIAVDSAVLFLGEREVADIAAAAAGDASVVGIDRDCYYATGAVVLDRAEVVAAADETLAARTAGGNDAVRDVDLTTRVRATDPTVVEVTAAGVVDLVFAPAIPGVRTARTVEATSAVRAQEATVEGAPPTGTPPATC